MHTVLVQMDMETGDITDLSNLKVAQAVPLELHTLKPGQKLPKGAVVVSKPQQLAAKTAAASGMGGLKAEAAKDQASRRATCSVC